MRKNLPSSLPAGNILVAFKKTVRTVSLFLLVSILLAGYASAQQVPPGLARQIQSLIDEKASRTPAQKKIGSQVLYAFKMRGGQRLTPEVASLRTGVVTDAQGRIKVEIDAVVTTKLLNELRKLGGEISFSSEKYGNLLVNIPLDKVEEAAGLSEVRHIDEWVAPMNNGGRSNEPGKDKNSNTNAKRAGIDQPARNFTQRPDFKTRAANIRKQLAAALDKTGLNGNQLFIGSVTSEADVTHKAALARTLFGVTGSNVKIGVISNGVDALAASQASGNLPPVVTVLPGQAGTGTEGVAMMELIYDLAPGADLYFATAFPTQAGFAQNILDLRAAGCDIIVDDVTYFREGVFQDDDVSRAVNTVTASGALYFSSAGNSGNQNDNTSGVWEGDFVDGGVAAAPFPATGNLHNFSNGTLYNILTADGRVTLKWSDPLGLSANDYDLYITNPAGTTIFATGASVQDGNDNPYEDVGTCFTGERIYILKKSAAATRALHLNTNRGRLTFRTPGVVYGHNAAASAYTVAATPVAAASGGGTPGPFPGVFNSSNKVELFSSDGPRRMFFNPDGSAITPGNLLFGTNGGIVLQKPDITAGDGAVTATPGFIPFYGTSAAAPHAAAIAALLKSKLPALTAAQIRTALVSTAIDIETPGIDRDAGAGIIMAYEALAAAGATSTYALLEAGPLTAVEGIFSNGNNILEPGEVASLTIPLKNLSPNIPVTGLMAVLTSTTPGITITQNSFNYGDIAGLATSVNTAAPYIIGIGASVPCGTSISFTLTVTYGGGETTQQIFTFTTRLGATPAPITAALGSAPPSGPGFISTSGTQTGRLNRNGITSTCAASKTTPLLQDALLRSYHAYTFTNTTASSQCVTVSISSASVTSIYQAVYGTGGYNPASIRLNYLADQGTTNNAAPFSFNVPAGQQYTVVVHEINTNGGIGVNYNLSVESGKICATPPSCTPIVLAPASLPGATLNTSYSQVITATGGSGVYQYSLSGALPTGLGFSGNTLSGVPSQLGSFPVTVTATDATGCPAGSQNYTVTVALPALSINDVTQSEGNIGTSTYTFTVGLSTPAGAGGVSFDIATANNTATIADNDYTAKSLTSQTIPQGISTYTFDVQVNGDNKIETNETFYVNISNVTGATVTDAQGVGTLTNDDFCAITITGATVTQPTCAFPTGTIVVNASGIASGTLEYSVDNGSTWQTGSTFNSLQPGNYYIIVRSQANITCTANYTGNPVILVSPFVATAIDTWTGCVSTDWAIPGNWRDGTVPTATDNVTIPNVTNDPIIAMAAPTKSVTVQAGAILTINAAGSLTINASTVHGLDNYGIVNNSGAVVLGNSSAIVALGIVQRNGGTFNNNAGGSIQIDQTGSHALLVLGIFNNETTITIGNNAPVVGRGIRVEGGSFTNNPGGDIRINRSGGAGVTNFATFTNSALLTIGNIAFTTQDDIYNAGTFINTATGDISVNRAFGNGVWNQSGSFQNNGKIRVGALANTGGSGILNTALFSNGAGAEIHIDRTPNGIANTNSFTNAGLIRIGFNAPLTSSGIVNVQGINAVFNNNAGGDIVIMQTTVDGLQNDVNSTFNNNACARLTVLDNLNNAGTFTNTGVFTVNTAQPHTNTALANNGIIEYPQGNPIPNVTNNDLVIAPITVCDNSTLSPALQIGGANSFTVGGTWYKDQALTQVAGTYNQATNTFSESGLAGGSDHTLYFSITDQVNACSRRASIKVTVTALPDVTATPSSQSICSGSTITTIGLSGNVGGTVYNWTRNNTGTVTGIAASGSGNISGTLTNATTAPITVTFSITPTANGCPGTTIYATVIVNPLTAISSNPAGQIIVALDNATFTVAATGTPPVSYRWQESTDGGATFNNLSDAGVYSGTGTNSLLLTAVPITMTGNKYRCVVTGGCSVATSIAATLTVNRRTTVITYTGDNNEQYSDRQTLTAILRDQVTGAVLVGKTVTFTLGTQVISDGPAAPGNGTDGSGIASAQLNMYQNSGAYTLVSAFAGDATYLASSDADAFTITKENAIADYTGPEFISVPCATCATATVMLSASIRDTSSVYPLNDQLPGDIRKARVKFINLNTMADISGWLIPGLVNAPDSLNGIVTFNWTVTLPTSGYDVYSIGVVVDGTPTVGNYIGSTETVLNISRSALGEFITGGGNIVPTYSAGQYPSDPGRKTNFGFNVKYNKSNKNLQGNLNIIYRAGNRVFQVKATAMNSLSLNSADPCSKKAVFTSKANLLDITNPSAPTSLYGGITLQITMADNGAGNTDKIGITLLNGNNLVYSSNWVSTQTVELLLNGGNLEVHNGVVCTSNPVTKAAPAVKVLEPLVVTNEGFEVKVSPNPSTTDFRIQVVSSRNEVIQVKLMDVSGRTIGTSVNRFAKSTIIIPGGKLVAGTYFVEVTQGNKRQVVKLLKMK